jgi:hypothetical protein
MNIFQSCFQLSRLLVILEVIEVALLVLYFAFDSIKLKFVFDSYVIRLGKTGTNLCHPFDICFFLVEFMKANRFKELIASCGQRKWNIRYVQYVCTLYNIFYDDSFHVRAVSWRSL